MAEAKNEYRQPPPGGVEIFLVHVGDDIWRLPDLLALAANDSRFRAFSSEVYGTVTSKGMQYSRALTYIRKR